jgi:hypothetical protein
MSRFKQADLEKVRTVSLGRRPSKAHVGSFGKVFDSPEGRRFFEALPQFLKATDLKEFILRAGKARRNNFPFQVLMGAHPIKVGLSPILIDLMEHNIVTGLSLNSAGLIHDLELAFTGKTSEDVAAGLKDGSFGMAEETGRMFAEVVNLAEEKGIGLGEAAGLFINGNKTEFTEFSLFAAGDRLNLPATVHLAIGTDIVSQQKSFNAGSAAEASFRDFKILADILIEADYGGVVANVGSAVVLPEVFLKALTVARNLADRPSDITTANFDMTAHYRPLTNVVKRPTEKGGKGYNFVGHHEIMLPLLAWGLKSFMNKNKETKKL